MAVIDPALAEPQVPASMPVSAAEAASSSVAPNVLTVYIDVAQLPVISVEAAAPNREAANRLAEAAVDILEARSSPTETRYTSRILTGGGAALKHQTYVVEPVAPVRTKEIVSRAAPTKQVGVVLLLGVWCAGVLAVPALLRRRVRLRVAPSAGGGPGFRPTPRPPARTE